MPWRENHPPLSNNRLAAEKRLQTLTKRLVEENLYEDYQKVFFDWEAAGIIEEVPDSGDGYFLPHRHVVKDSGTTRIRPVFDASANSKSGPSLNQCLETGPNLIELIPNLLIRFRKHEIGVSADIKQAFLQISVSLTDRDVLRFLWWSQTEPRKIVMYRHRRVVFGVNSSPFLLGATIEYHLENLLELAKSREEQRVLTQLKESFYVDNCVTSVKTQEERADFQSRATETMQRGGFKLRGWEFTGTDVDQGPSSILGILWNKSADTLSLCLNFTDCIETAITKRKILSAAHKLFDPLGWCCPTLLIPKLMLKDLWLEKIGWDSEVSIDTQF